MEKLVIYGKNNDYPIEKLTPENFEELCYELLKYSSTLKKNINYTDAFFKIGGRDQAKDGILYNEGKEIGISQSKHTKDSMRVMNSNVVTNEILKMLLYSLKNNLKIKKYVFFISSYVKEETNTMLLNFAEEFLKKVDIEKKVKNIINKYIFLKEDEYIKNTKISDIVMKIYKICKNIEIHFYYNTDIQTFLNECPYLIEKYFPIKTIAVEKQKYEIPLIEESELKNFIEDKDYLYKNGRYKEKLIEIEIENFYIEEATKDIYSKCLSIIKLHNKIPIELSANIKEYENNLLTAEKYRRIKHKSKLSPKCNIKKAGRDYYMDFIEELSFETKKIQIRNFEYVSPTFAKGTIHELVNDKKIEDWLFKLKEEK